MKLFVFLLWGVVFGWSLFPILPGLVEDSALLFYQTLIGTALWMLLIGKARLVSSFRGSSAQGLWLLFLAVGAAVTISAGRFTPWMGLQWTAAAIYFILAVHLFSCSEASDLRRLWKVVVVCLLLEMATGYVQAVIVLWQGLPVTRIVGTLDSSTGLAATMVLLVVCVSSVSTEKDMSQHFRIFQWSVTALTSLLVVLLCSRSGLLALLAVGLVSHASQLQKGFRRKRLVGAVAGILLCLFIGGLYVLKRNSTDGRLLIYRCTAEMVARSPWTGYGHEGFQSEYMPLQAAYFSAHPDSRFALLADTVCQPMNEALRFLVEYGCPGFLLLALLYGLAVKKALCRSSDPAHRMATRILLAATVMSLFSYPLTYTFMQGAVLTALAYLLRLDAPPGSLRKKTLAPSLVCLVTGGILLGGSCFYYLQERKWRDACRTARKVQLVLALPAYEKLRPVLRQKRNFLYNYATVANEAGLYKRSDSLLTNYRHWGWSFDCALLASDNALAQGDTVRARDLLQQARLLMPVRFLPLYQLMKLAQKQGKKKEARRWALQLLHKPIKIPSEEIEWMREDAKNVTFQN